MEAWGWGGVGVAKEGFLDSSWARLRLTYTECMCMLAELRIPSEHGGFKAPLYMHLGGDGIYCFGV
jgi:hypothetical protein